jgi:hypothetical protein
MSDQPKKDATPAGAQDELRGGTQTGGANPQPNMGATTGGTNSLSPVGASQPDKGPAAPPGGAAQRSGGTRTDSRNDPEELFEGTRKPSPAIAKERARDGAHVETTHGVPAAPGNPKQHDETDPTGQSNSAGAAVTKGSTAQKGTGERK